MKTNRTLGSTKANALRVRRELKAKKLKDLRNNILLGALAFIGYIFLLFIDVNGFSNYNVFAKAICLVVLFVIGLSCLNLLGGDKRKVVSK